MKFLRGMLEDAERPKELETDVGNRAQMAECEGGAFATGKALTKAKELDAVDDNAIIIK